MLWDKLTWTPRGLENVAHRERCVQDATFIFWHAVIVRLSQESTSVKAVMVQREIESNTETIKTGRYSFLIIRWKISRLGCASNSFGVCNQLLLYDGLTCLS